MTRASPPRACMDAPPPLAACTGPPFSVTYYIYLLELARSEIELRRESMMKALASPSDFASESEECVRERGEKTLAVQKCLRKKKLLT